MHGKRENNKASASLKKKNSLRAARRIRLCLRLPADTTKLENFKTGKMRRPRKKKKRDTTPTFCWCSDRCLLNLKGLLWTAALSSQWNSFQSHLSWTLIAARWMFSRGQIKYRQINRTFTKWKSIIFWKNIERWKKNIFGGGGAYLDVSRFNI